MPPKKKHDREFCRLLFVHEGKEVAEIRAITGVPESNIYYWKNSEDWDQQRIDHRLNPRFIASQIEQSIANLFEIRRQKKGNEGKLILEGGDGDAIYKLLKARADILKESNYMGIAFDVTERLQKYLRDKHPKRLDNEFSNIIADFLKQLFSEL